MPRVPPSALGATTADRVTGQMFGCVIGDQPATAEEKDAFAASIAKLPSGAGGLRAGKPERP